MPREVITLQVGHASNWVGTHFWNAQESYGENGPHNEIDTSVLYREGVSIYGEPTYSPRLILFDLKGSFGSLRKSNPVYEQDEENPGASTWHGRVETYAQEPHQRNAFLNHLDQEGSEAVVEPSSFASDLDQSAAVWSDFNKLYYHPKTMVEIQQYTHADEENQFALFTQGQDLFANADFRDDFGDERLRFFVEECDSLQGFNITADAINGFSGLSASIVEYLREEFPKKTSMVFGLHDHPVLEKTEKDRKVNQLRNVNAALATSHLAEHSSLYVPIFAPAPKDLDPNGWSKYLQTDFSKLYHWSAYIAAGLDTVTLPYRLKNGLLMGDLVSVVNGGRNAKIGAFAQSIPFPVHRTLSLGTSLKPLRPHAAIPWIRDLTLRDVDQADEQIGQCAVLRGTLEGAKHQEVAQTERVFSAVQARELFDGFLSSYSTPMARSFQVDTPWPITETFPSLLSPFIDQNGLINTQPINPPVTPSHIPILTRLHTTPRIKKVIEDMARAVRTVPSRVAKEFEKGDHGIGVEEFRSLAEGLDEVADEYELIL
ncbi:Protein misato 1 [Rhizophlyctis rosea]|nr:Protein misato 1 [Rhizophlyctis rosea]